VGIEGYREVESPYLQLKIVVDNPITNFNIGHSGIYIVIIESDGRITLYNLR
jgi:hypothetical protein